MRCGLQIPLEGASRRLSAGVGGLGAGGQSCTPQRGAGPGTPALCRPPVRFWVPPCRQPPEATALRSGSVGPRLQGEPASVSRIPCDSARGRHLISSLRSEAPEVCWAQDSLEPVRKACGFSSGIGPPTTNVHRCTHSPGPLPFDPPRLCPPVALLSSPSGLLCGEGPGSLHLPLTSNQIRDPLVQGLTLTNEPHRPGPACAFLLLLHIFGMRPLSQRAGASRDQIQLKRLLVGAEFGQRDLNYSFNWIKIHAICACYRNIEKELT